MNLLSKVSLYKINCLATKVEIVSSLYALGLINGDKANKMNKQDVFKVIELSKNLTIKDAMKLKR